MLVMTGGSLDRARRGGGVPADQRDPQHRRLLDHGRLFERIDVAENDAVRLQRDRLVERRRASLHRALAVEDAEVPSDDAWPPPARRRPRPAGRRCADRRRHRRSASCACAVGTGRRTGPGRAGRRDLGDVLLRHREVGIVCTAPSGARAGVRARVRTAAAAAARDGERDQRGGGRQSSTSAWRHFTISVVPC